MIELIVNKLIESRSEGGYWDFKQQWHSNNADLVKDIICLANNTTATMENGYLIFGIEDNTFEITGVPDINRKNQEKVLGLISELSWSNEEIPEICVHSVRINNVEIDVLEISNKDITPYYLLKDYTQGPNGSGRIIVRAGVIYSRVGDRNTNTDRTATKDATEFLWKKRFGLVGDDDFKISKRLKNVDDWYIQEDTDTFYNRINNDIFLRKNPHYEFTQEIHSNSDETVTMVMDFP